MITAGMKVTPKYRCRGVHFPSAGKQNGDVMFHSGDVGVVHSVVPPSKPGWPDVAIVLYRGEEFGIHVTDVVEVNL